MSTHMRFEDGPRLVEAVRSDTQWDVTATDGFEDILPPFTLPLTLPPAAVFQIAMHRYERALLAEDLGVDEQLLIGDQPRTAQFTALGQSMRGAS